MHTNELSQIVCCPEHLPPLSTISAAQYKFSSRNCREKLSDTWESFLHKQNECDKLRAKLSSDRALVVALADDLEDAQQSANALYEQKISILDDVDRLKGLH